MTTDLVSYRISDRACDQMRSAHKLWSSVARDVEGVVHFALWVNTYQLLYSDIRRHDSVVEVWL